MYWIKLLFVIVSVNVIQGARILCLFPSPSRSHLIVAKAILTELARNGHETTMVSFFPIDKPLENYRDIVVPKSDTHKETQKLTASTLDGKENLFLRFPRMIDLVLKLNDEAVNSKEFQPILEEKFDLIMLGPFMNFYLVGFGAHFNCPIIMFSMGGTFNILNTIVGNPFEISYVPHLIYGIKGSMNFKQRLTNLAITIAERGMTWYLQKRNNELYMKTFGHKTNFPSYEDQLKNISLVFINDHFTQSGNRPLVVNLVEIGGIQVKEQPNPLPDDINNWMSSNPNGVVYFSLGSNIKSSSLSAEKLQALLNTFGKLKQNVLWKFENDKIDGLPKNVMIRKWLPQDDLLTHPNLKVFITHGGLGSIAEAKYHAIPLVLIPIFGDQTSNANKIVDEGWGVLLQYTDLTEETLTNSINEIINNPKYKQTVQHRSNLYRDRPQTSRQAVVYWTNYILRYHGAPHLQSLAKELNFFQRNSIDTFAFLFAVLFVILYVQFKIVKCTIRYVIRKLSKIKNKID